MSFQLDTSGEVWRAVVGYEGFYEVSDHGHVRSLPRTIQRGGKPMRIAGLPLRLKRNRAGYVYVNISRDGDQKAVLVSRLVALAFIPNPDDKPEVGHDDNDTSNNRKANLVWSTRLENQAHAASQVRLRGKLTAEQIAILRASWPALKAGEKGALARRFGITGNHLWRIGTRRAHRHVAEAA